MNGEIAVCSILVERATNVNEILTIYNISALIHTLALHYHDAALEYSGYFTLISAILHRLPRIRNTTLEGDEYSRCALYSIPYQIAPALQASSLVQISKSYDAVSPQCIFHGYRCVSQPCDVFVFEMLLMFM
jgi:hypothetical protein